MPQWAYLSLTLVFASKELYCYLHQPKGTTPQPLSPQILADHDNPALTLRRWAADLGLHSWELVNIITTDQSQEWVFKKPI